MGEDLLRYSNKIESSDLRQCPYDHAKKAYLSGITVKGKVFPYSLPSVGPGADPGVQAVSPQVT